MGTLKRPFSRKKHWQGGSPFDKMIYVAIAPVSYTHLDVYKRQPYADQKKPADPAHLCGCFVPTPLAGALHRKRLNLSACACLLYTSRCV